MKIKIKIKIKRIRKRKVASKKIREEEMFHLLNNYNKVKVNYLYLHNSQKYMNKFLII